jgi:hypothetical protein
MILRKRVQIRIYVIGWMRWEWRGPSGFLICTFDVESRIGISFTLDGAFVLGLITKIGLSWRKHPSVHSERMMHKVNPGISPFGHVLFARTIP